MYMEVYNDLPRRVEVIILYPAGAQHTWTRALRTNVKFFYWLSTSAGGLFCFNWKHRACVGMLYMRLLKFLIFRVNRQITRT